MIEERLPLFPLQLVLFPDSRLPLHIFEERYKVLINDCIRTGAEFGIVLMNGSAVSGVGCTAQIVSVSKVYDDGRMDIVVEGKRRFRIRRVDERTAPVLVGFVEELRSRGGEADQELAEETIRLYNTLVGLAFRSSVKPIVDGARNPVLSFLIAQKAGMDLAQRQKVLETLTEEERLRILREHLSAMIPRLAQAEEMEQVVRSDGYLPRSHTQEEE